MWLAVSSGSPWDTTPPAGEAENSLGLLWCGHPEESSHRDSSAKLHWGDGWRPGWRSRPAAAASTGFSLTALLLCVLLVSILAALSLAELSPLTPSSPDCKSLGEESFTEEIGVTGALRGSPDAGRLPGEESHTDACGEWLRSLQGPPHHRAPLTSVY